MKQSRIINAYSITEALSSSESLTTMGKWVLYSVRKTLSPHYEFQMEENKKLIEKYNGKVSENTIQFETPEDATAFQKEFNEIEELEIDMDFKKQEVKLSDIPDITIKQMEALEDFIEFIPE